jgi:hypothetical protein
MIPNQNITQNSQFTGKWEVSTENFNLYILKGLELEILEVGRIFHFVPPKKKLWGLFKGLKVEEKDIEEAKKSLFPEREF